MKRFKVDFRGIEAADGTIISDENADILSAIVEDCIHYYRLGRRNTYLYYGISAGIGLVAVAAAGLAIRYFEKRKWKKLDGYSKSLER